MNLSNCRWSTLHLQPEESIEDAYHQVSTSLAQVYYAIEDTLRCDIENQTSRALRTLPLENES